MWGGGGSEGVLEGRVGREVSVGGKSVHASAIESERGGGSVEGGGDLKGGGRKSL